MDRKVFFDSIRGTGLFGKALASSHVTGCEALLDASMEWGLTNPHHVAHVLAHAHHETGAYMLPIKETVQAHHVDKNPSDAEVIRRLDVAWKKGQLSWVSTPYWRDGWFGRGFIQITHLKNYLKLGTAIGVDLVANRDASLNPAISAATAVVGMRDGLFTGKKLSDYKFPDALTAKPKENPRRIVNGEDGTDAKIAKSHIFFYDALVKAGYGVNAATCRAVPQTL